MDLSKDEREQLYLIAWQGDTMRKRWLRARVVSGLVKAGLVKKTSKGFIATPQGRASLSSMARMACQRPVDYHKCSGETQWAIDKGLGLLDWDGS